MIISNCEIKLKNNYYGNEKKYLTYYN